MRIQKFVIAGSLPGTEEMVQVAKRSQHAYNTMKKAMTDCVAMEAMVAKLQPCTGPVLVDVHWVERAARRDKDNICGGLKFIMDGLRARGIIQNDGWRYVLGFTHQFSIDKQRSRIHVSLIEADHPEDERSRHVR